MTTPTPRWTADVESAVTSRIGRFVAGMDGEFLVNRDLARMILADLADAGVLMPVGGETHDVRDCPYSSCRTHAFTKHTHRRSVTTWPDGATLTGPWREVTDDPA